MGKDKLMGNPNHTPEGKIDYKNKSTANPAKAGGGQKGTFVGKPSGIHIHIVADNTHLQIGGDRTDFDPAKKAEVKKALAELVKSKKTSAPGYDDCLTWLTKKAK
jgi:hypothetical protein